MKPTVTKYLKMGLDFTEMTLSKYILLDKTLFSQSLVDNI